MDNEFFYDHPHWNRQAKGKGANANLAPRQRYLVVFSLVAILFITAFASVLPVQAATYFCEGFAATIIGTSGSDVRSGTNGRDVFVMLEGNDTVNGFGGDDIICTNEGDDTIYAGVGNDLVFGGQGSDHIYGGDGTDVLNGNKGVDYIYGYGGDDTIYGNEDNDELHGDGCQIVPPAMRSCAQGQDTIYGGQGNDKIWGGYLKDTLSGNLGVDIIDGDGDTNDTDLIADYCSTGETYINCTFLF